MLDFIFIWLFFNYFVFKNNGLFFFKFVEKFFTKLVIGKIEVMDHDHRTELYCNMDFLNLKKNFLPLN